MESRKEGRREGKQLGKGKEGKREGSKQLEKEEEEGANSLKRREGQGGQNHLKVRKLRGQGSGEEESKVGAVYLPMAQTGFLVCVLRSLTTCALCVGEQRQHTTAGLWHTSSMNSAS